MAIIITKDGKNASRIDRTSFQNEDYLQRYIYDNPNSVPLYEIDENIKLLILAREFPTKSGPVDAIGIDYTGEIYVIETKLYKNSDKRLVIAQVLDYGASLAFTYKGFSEFLQIIESKVNRDFSISLTQRINNFFGINDEEATLIIENIKNNLDKGKFRFVVLMDTIESRLKDLIIFLNQNSRFDIYGVELEYYKYDDFEIVIPKLHGAEVKKDINVGSTTSGARQKWDEATFISEIETKLNSEAIIAIKNLYEFVKRTADKIAWGTGNDKGSFNSIYLMICSRSLFSVYTNGSLVINAHWMEENEKMKSYRDQLISDVSKLFNISNEGGVRYFIRISEWQNKGSEFENIIEKLIVGK